MIPARRLCRLTLLAVLPALACSQSPPPKPAATREETRSTRATDLRDTQALLLLMADQKRFEETVFVALLDSSASVRRDLAGALGRIGDPRGRGILQGLLIDTESAVRQAAAFGLGELGTAEAVPALLRATVDDDSSTGVLAVEALGKLHAPLADVRRTLTALEPLEAARRLAPALFRFQEESLVEAAVELEGSPAVADPIVHAGAAYALGRDARVAALPHLRRLLADPEAKIRAEPLQRGGRLSAHQEILVFGETVEDRDRGLALAGHRQRPGRERPHSRQPGIRQRVELGGRERLPEKTHRQLGRLDRGFEHGGTHGRVGVGEESPNDLRHRSARIPHGAEVAGEQGFDRRHPHHRLRIAGQLLQQVIEAEDTGRFRGPRPQRTLARTRGTPGCRLRLRIPCLGEGKQRELALTRLTARQPADDGLPHLGLPDPCR